MIKNVLVTALFFCSFWTVIADDGVDSALYKKGYRQYYDGWLTHNSHQLQMEIDCQNLLNSLYLSELQTRHLISVGVNMEKVRELYKPEIEKINNALSESLEIIKKDVMGGKDKFVSFGWKQSVQLEERLNIIKKKIQEKELYYEMYAKAILTPNQREKCYNYQHCLIPVKDLKDPTRVGSADAGTVAEKLLDSVRKMSDSELVSAMPSILSNQYKCMERYMGELSLADREKEKAKMVDIFSQIRKLSDLDYQIQKSRFGSMIPCDYMSLKSRIFDVSCKLNKARSEATDSKCSGPIGLMFLRPCMIPILAKRINILNSWEGTEQVDLNKVKAAAECKNGSCAID